MYSSIAVAMWFPFPVSVTYAPLSCWASLITRKDHVGWDPIWCSWNFVVQCMWSLSNVSLTSMGGMQAQTLAFFWWNWGETFTPPVDPLSWLRCLSKAKATLLSHCAEARSALCSSGGLSHPVLFPELRGRFSLAQLLQAFCYRALWSLSVLEQSLRLIWEVAGQSQLVFMISSHTRYSLER